MEQLLESLEAAAPIAPIGSYDPPPLEQLPIPKVALDQLSPYRFSWDDGSKFPGDFGDTLVLTPDYWTLRQRSAQLFETNIYARGVIRRIVTNEIATGLFLECMPEEKILGYPEDGLEEWSELVENRFELWANNPVICDQNERLTWGELHIQARTEALVTGDVLVVMRQDPRTLLPRVQLINGAAVRTPFGAVVRQGNRIKEGVELDSQGRHVAFWIQQDDGTAKRLPAFGEKSGRRLAWLLYGTDKRMDDIRGKPLLSLMLQSLKEIDRYRDSIQRKATVLSMLAMFVYKSQPVTGTRPLTAGGGIQRRATDLATAPSTGTAERSYSAVKHIPGLTMDVLAHGEEPKAFQHNGTTEGFGEFERAIVASVAWTHEIPPEVLLQSYDSNYSASQAALNDYKGVLSKNRTTFGKGMCQPVYTEWLYAEVLAQRVKAPGLVEAWNDFSQWYIFGAWTRADWSGNVKPTLDPLKLVNATEKALGLGITTHDRAAREFNGSSFAKNVKKLKRENVELAAANKPLVELNKPAKPPPPARNADEDEPDEEDEEES